MSPDKPGTPSEGKPDEAKLAAEAADAAQEKAPAAKAEGKGEGSKAAKGEPKAKAEKAKAAKEGAKAKVARKAPAKKAAKAAEAKEQADKGDGEAAVAAPEKAAKASRSRGQGSAAPARRRVVRAKARYVRTSARKARMVCGHIRGKSVQEARAILDFTPREVARDWKKLLDSAVANAEANHELLEEDLIVREAYADEGPTIKRFRPRAMGRATPIRKRTSHLTIALIPRPEGATNKRKG